MVIDGGIMRGVETRSKCERIDDAMCRALYNKVVAKITANKFSIKTEEDKLLMEQLRSCETQLREMRLYTDLIYDRQVKEGNDIQEQQNRQLERDERQRRNERDADDRECAEADNE